MEKVAELQMEQTLTVSWQVIGTLAAIFAMTVGIATGYLRLFISVKLAELETKMLTNIKTEFARKEAVDHKTERLAERLYIVEKKVFPEHYV